MKAFVTFDTVKVKKLMHKQYKKKKCCECCYKQAILKIWLFEKRLYFNHSIEPLNLNFFNLPISKCGRYVRTFIALFITFLLLLVIAVGYVYMS